MNHDITHYATSRHSAKAYDPNKKISDEDVEKIKTLLRYSPSSTNAQPWRFFIASTPESKALIASSSTDKKYPFNSQAIKDASHVVVFCRRLDLEQDFLLRVLAQEEADGRFAADPEQFKARMHAGRNMFINIHKDELHDLHHWMEKQVYLNLGAFLLGVAALGVDATPMEGVDTQALDEALGLKELGAASIALVPLGYHDPSRDFNATLPKSRLPLEDIITEL